MTQILEQFNLIPTVSPNTLQLSQWVDDLLPTPGANGVPDLLTAPAQTATYLHGLADLQWEVANQRPLVRIADANLENFWELDGELDCDVQALLDDTGKLNISILWENWIQDLLVNETLLTEDINILIDPDPTNQDWRTRWGGKITEIHIKKDEKGNHTIQLVGLHFREHAKRLLVAANPVFPPEVQLPRMWVMPGPCRTALAVTSFVNLARLFEPGVSTVTNVLNPAGWINPLNPDAALNILPTGWPIQIAFVDTVLDQSRWTSVGATWTTWHETYKDILADAGCCMKAYTYLTTDKDSPNTELASLVSLAPDIISSITGVDAANLLNQVGVQKLTAPTRNCVVIAFEQIDGVTGPTGTAADGFIHTVAVTLDDLITPVLIDLGTGNTYDQGVALNGESVQDASGVDGTYLIEQLLDVAPAPPSVIWWDAPYNGIMKTELIYHKGAVKTIMTGSKSPVIVNEAITFAIRYSLAELSAVISSQIGQTYQTPGSPGLDNLYQGQLDNTLLAWERFTDPIRALYAGDVAWQEHFERGSGTAYTLASILTLRSGDYKTRSFAAFTAEPQNGFPWIADIDYFLGDRVGFEQDGIIYADNVYGIQRKWDWDSHLSVVVKIGEDKAPGDPFAAAFKTMANMYSLVGEIAGEGSLFE